MKLPTFNRGAWLVCALTLLLALTLADAGPALAARCTKADSFECKTFQKTGGSDITSGGAGGSLVRTVVGLAIVLAVIYGLYWVMKQARVSKNPATGYGLEQLASLPLGTNRALALVRVGAEVHLIGISEQGITGIRVYSEEEAYELGLPLEGLEDATSGWDGGLPPIQRVVHTLKRFTLR